MKRMVAAATPLAGCQPFGTFPYEGDSSRTGHGDDPAVPGLSPHG